MTSDFFEYVKRHSESPSVADIAISDQKFRKIEKRSALIEIATIIVN